MSDIKLNTEQNKNVQVRIQDKWFFELEYCNRYSGILIPFGQY